MSLRRRRRRNAEPSLKDAVTHALVWSQSAQVQSIYSSSCSLRAIQFAHLGLWKLSQGALEPLPSAYHTNRLTDLAGRGA